MTRGQAKVTDNSEYLAFVRQNFLNRLKDNLPKTVLDKTTWLSSPNVLTEVKKSTLNENFNIILTLCQASACSFLP